MQDFFENNKKIHKKLRSSKKHSPIRPDITTEKNGSRHVGLHVTFVDAERSDTLNRMYGESPQSDFQFQPKYISKV